MGKKGKAKPEPEKPFTFAINNFQVERTRPGMMRLLPVIPPGFEQVAFKLKITKNFQTGKPKYDMVYYECSMLEDHAAQAATDEGSPKDLRVFSLFVPDTGRTLLVDPKRTQGQPPFVALDPVSNKEETIDPHFIIHHDPATSQNFLLDLRKFEAGKLTFKDETQKTVEADITKRVDPLTRKPLHQVTDDHADVKFIGLMKKGENYVIKSEETGNIQILDNSGNLVDVTGAGYVTSYDEETDTTNLMDANEEILLTIDGKVSLEELHSKSEDKIEDENKKKLDTKNKFQKIQNPTTGKISIVNDKGEVVESLENHYYVFENPATGKLELVDASGQSVDLPEFKLVRDPKTGKKILVDMKGQPLSDSVKQLSDMILVNGEDVPMKEQLLSSGSIRGDDKYQHDPAEKSQINKRKSVGKQDKSPGASLVPNKDNLKTGRTSTSLIGFEEQSSKQKGKDDVANTPGAEITKDAGSLLPQLLKSDIQAEKGESGQEKLEVEKYFEELEYEEARYIVSQVNAATAASRPIFLRVLMEVIELNLDLIRCALTQKRKTETKYANILLHEKQTRQKQFLLDLIKSHGSDYDQNKLQTKAMRKLERENELLLDRLDSRITAENNMVMNLVKENIMQDSKKIIKYTNIPCYRSFKRIVYKELMKLLDLEIQQVKLEVCKMLKTEKETIVLKIKDLAAYH